MDPKQEYAPNALPTQKYTVSPVEQMTFRLDCVQAPKECRSFIGLQQAHDIGNLLQNLRSQGRRLLSWLHRLLHRIAVPLVVVAQLEDGVGLVANLLHDGHDLEPGLCLFEGMC